MTGDTVIEIVAISEFNSPSEAINSIISPPLKSRFGVYVTKFPLITKIPFSGPEIILKVRLSLSMNPHLLMYIYLML